MSGAVRVVRGHFPNLSGGNVTHGEGQDVAGNGAGCRR